MTHICHFCRRDFNPRSSCEERQTVSSITTGWIISIHAPHARSDSELLIITCLSSISIHAPHARSDTFCHMVLLLFNLFQSTLLMRGATRTVLQFQLFNSISIHAPHARSDCQIPRPYKQRDSDQFSANPKKINIITAFMHIYIMFGTGSR